MNISLQDLAGLKRYATTNLQLQYIKAVEEHGGNAAAASKSLGLHKDSVLKCLKRLKKSAARRGYAPEFDLNHPSPEGYNVTGVSTLYDAESGKPKIQWVKTASEKDKVLEIAMEHVTEVFSDPSMKVSRIAAPSKKLDKDLMIAYPMGDPHMGMFSWGEETGADFDLKIAENNLVEATRRLIDCGPNAETGIIVNVGDFYHSDNQSNRTTRSGNVLDVDNRWAKVLRVGVRAMRACIELALQKHKTVYVINEIGNHDDHTAQVLTLALSMAYENNPRIHFDTSPAKFHYHKFGSVLLGVTHGDTVKPEKLGELMATDRAVDWGATKFRYWYTGHIHTRRVFELPGCMVESFRTLAAKDAWTAGAGYRSGRDMYAIVLHKEFGEIERHRVDVAMLD